jgi:hypothetical protein
MGGFSHTACAMQNTMYHPSQNRRATPSVSAQNILFGLFSVFYSMI